MKITDLALLENSLGLMPAVLQTKNSIIINVANSQINPKIQSIRTVMPDTKRKIMQEIENIAKNSPVIIPGV